MRCKELTASGYCSCLCDRVKHRDDINFLAVSNTSMSARQSRALAFRGPGLTERRHRCRSEPTRLETGSTEVLWLSPLGHPPPRPARDPRWCLGAGWRRPRHRPGGCPLREHPDWCARAACCRSHRGGGSLSRRRQPAILKPGSFLSTTSPSLSDYVAYRGTQPTDQGSTKGVDWLHGHDPGSRERRVDAAQVDHGVLSGAT